MEWKYFTPYNSPLTLVKILMFDGFLVKTILQPRLKNHQSQKINHDFLTNWATMAIKVTVENAVF